MEEGLEAVDGLVCGVSVEVDEKAAEAVAEGEVRREVKREGAAISIRGGGSSRSSTALSEQSAGCCDVICCLSSRISRRLSLSFSFSLRRLQLAGHQRRQLRHVYTAHSTRRLATTAHRHRGIPAVPAAMCPHMLGCLALGAVGCLGGGDGFIGEWVERVGRYELHLLLVEGEQRAAAGESEAGGGEQAGIALTDLRL